MDTQIWEQGPPQKPSLNWQNMKVIGKLYGPNPLQQVSIELGATLLDTDQRIFLPITNLAPPTVVIRWQGGMFVFCAGTSGTIHVPALLDGWANPASSPDQEWGVTAAFSKAARQIIANSPSSFFAGIPAKIFLAGHSYGGAVMQALAIHLRNLGSEEPKVWSYGSPRPGNKVCQTLLANVSNTRFFGDDDPVRFIPPRASDLPSLTAVLANDLIAGMDSQVQAKTGWQIDATGNIAKYEGAPTGLHPVTVNIAAWIADYSGFRSVNHSPETYIARFALANSLPVTPTVAIVPSPIEYPYTVRPRQLDAIQEAGYAEIQANANTATGINSSIVVAQIPANSPLRYRARKSGKVWVVKLGADIVGAGPGKRKAKTLARKLNRAAQATAFLASI